MGSVLTVAMGIAGWNCWYIKDVHFRGLAVSPYSILHSHVLPQICDETNQARGFALITTMGGIGRLLVC